VSIVAFFNLNLTGKIIMLVHFITSFVLTWFTWKILLPEVLAPAFSDMIAGKLSRIDARLFLRRMIFNGLSSGEG